MNVLFMMPSGRQTFEANTTVVVLRSGADRIKYFGSFRGNILTHSMYISSNRCNQSFDLISPVIHWFFLISLVFSQTGFCKKKALCINCGIYSSFCFKTVRRIPLRREIANTTRSFTGSVQIYLVLVRCNAFSPKPGIWITDDEQYVFSVAVLTVMRLTVSACMHCTVNKADNSRHCLCNAIPVALLANIGYTCELIGWVANGIFARRL